MGCRLVYFVFYSALYINRSLLSQVIKNGFTNFVIL